MPILQVPYDTFKTAKRLEVAEPLPSKGDSSKVDVLAKVVRECVDISATFGR